MPLDRSTDTAPDLLALGEVVLDVVADALPAAGRPVHASVSARPGGSPVTAARAAVAAGASAAVAGRVGADWAGGALRDELERAGVRALLAVDPELPTGVVVSFAGEKGARAVVAGRGASARLTPEDVPARITPRVLLVSGYTLFAEGPGSEAAQHALATVPTEWRAVDLASAGLLRARGRGAALRLLADADAVLASADEAEAATGLRRPEEAARALAEGRRAGCVTLGAAGAVLVVDGTLARARPPRVLVRDPVGAGDALAGTLLPFLARGIAADDALARACAAGAASGD